MQDILNLFLLNYILSPFIFIYFFSLIVYIASYLIKSKKNNICKKYDGGISIVVCIRNGEKSVRNLINDLKTQLFNGALEFIIVDDESTDNTSKIIRKEIKGDNRFKYISTENYKSNLKYKKRALKKGISVSKYEWLLFTDVDCRFGANWVESMSLNFSNCDYLVGFSLVKTNNTLISYFQNLDYKMLMFATNAAILLSTPLASSGQNQSFKRSLFDSIGGYNKIATLLQGDDSIFLQICNKIKSLKVNFSINENSFVYAKTHSSWKQFLLQRIRWAGDANIMWKFNKLFYLVIISTFISNFYVIFYFFHYLVTKNISSHFIFILSIKLILEFLLFSIGSIYFKFKNNVVLFLFWFLMQPIYIVLVGATSYFLKYFRWRERKIS